MASALHLGTCIIETNFQLMILYKEASDGFKLDSKRLWWAIVIVVVICKHWGLTESESNGINTS
jgi:hypothetical protein